jgi:hypothetical protein
MAFTNDTTNQLARFQKQVDYILELSPDAGATWQALPYTDFALTREADTPASLRASLPGLGLYSSEADPNNPVKLLTHVRFTCTVDSESEVLFAGRVYRIEPREASLELYAQDWRCILAECECEVSLAPAETDELAPARQLALIGDGVFGSVYGFTYHGAGDAAFNTAGEPGTRRRAWAADDIRVWYDELATSEVPPQHYQVNLTSGTVAILEDTAGHAYYASGVRCYMEGTLDWAEVIEAALTYPASLGGPGLASEQLDLPALGLDAAAPVYYRGRVDQLLKQVLDNQQANLCLLYDHINDCFTLRLITQLASGAEQWQLFHAQTAGVPRELHDLYSRVVVTGLSERPRNALTEASTTVMPREIGTWFSWDGLNVGTDSSFTSVGGLMWNGDASQGASVHNLPPSEGGGADQYTSLYELFTADLGAALRISRVRATLPGSRNLNAAAGHQGCFWPGLRILASEDGTRWRLLSAKLAGRFPPHEQVEASGTELLSPKARYLRVLCGAYKHGTENQDDPSIGLAELEVYTSEEYRVVKEADAAASPPSYYSYCADYDGDGAADTWRRNQPALLARLGGRHRTLFTDQSGVLNEYLAHDYALDLLAESVRLMRQAAWRCVCDPRVRLYDTVTLADPPPGAPASILVERVVLRPDGTEITGTDYLGNALTEAG